jgi:putative lipoprotein (rSAM/lipoprotein system)
LGFSCNRYGLIEYGSPHAEYSVKGAVTDVSGAPVAGIEILIKDRSGYDESKPAYTNGQGEFDVTYSAFPNEKFILTATDVDGEANGSFKADSVEVVFSKDDFYKPGDGHWYDGAARKEIPPIVLKEEAGETDE